MTVSDVQDGGGDDSEAAGDAAGSWAEGEPATVDTSAEESDDSGESDDSDEKPSGG
jgi:hypothetical protein